MTMPPQPPPQQSFGVPPGRFVPPSAPTPEPRRRELGEDPALARAKRRRWVPWALISVGAIAVLALVATLIVSSFSAPNPIDVVPTGGPVADGVPSQDPSSTLATSSPQEPAPGSTIPITMDVSFPSGLTFVIPGADGGWVASTSERQPDAVTLEHSASDAYLQILETTPAPSTYRDEDLTLAFLNTAQGSFTSNPTPVGPPESMYISGAGYSLEVLAQRLEWTDSWTGDSSVAYVVSRIMPGAESSLQAYIIAPKSEIDNPNSAVWKKFAELTFTVP